MTRAALRAPAELLAAAWTLRALGTVRRELAAGGLHGIEVSDPGRIALRGWRGVRIVLRARHASCLEQALVRQRFSAAAGDVRDVVIGVGSPAEAFAAHAWLDGEDDGDVMGLHELTRVPAA